MNRSYATGCAAVLIFAALLRFWAIDIKPAHFDEGINGWFADRLKQTGFHAYDPTNYHGPLHFYAVFVSQELLGRSVFALRLPAILAGLLGIAAILRLGPAFFGRPAALLAAFGMAVSPAFVFYTRYSIHESTLVLFNILFFFGVLGLWKNGTRGALFLAIGGLAGMVLTKETYLLQAGSLLLAFPCLALWNRIVPPTDPFRLARINHKPSAATCGRQAGTALGSNRGSDSMFSYSPPAIHRPPCPSLPRAASRDEVFDLCGLSARQWNVRDAVVAAAIALGVIVFFYSGTFMNWPGVHGLWKTFAAWFETGIESGGHAKTDFDLLGPLNTYWLWLAWKYEAFVLAGIAASILCILPQSPVPRLTAIYGCGLLLAYSVIPYKTPWCILAWAWLFFLVGPAVAMSLRRAALRNAAIVLLLLLALVDAGRMLRLNFREFANPAEPYVYVQTFPEINLLTRPLLDAASNNPAMLLVRGEILIPSYYPLPWILGDFPNIAYFGAESWPERITADFVVVEEKRKAEALGRMEPGYYEVPFRLRDSMEPCVALFRESVFPIPRAEALESRSPGIDAEDPIPRQTQ